MIFTVPEKDETSYPIDLFVSFQFSHQWLFFCLFVCFTFDCHEP